MKNGGHIPEADISASRSRACSVGVLLLLSLSLQLHAASVEGTLNQFGRYSFGDDPTPVRRLRAQVRASLRKPRLRRHLASGLADLLQDDGVSYGAKQIACRELALIGAEPEVSALAGLLGRPRLSDCAVYALVQIDSPAADRALRNGLDQADGRPLVGIIHALGRRRDEKASDRLMELLEASPPSVAQAAAGALSRIGGPGAARAIGNAFEAAEEPGDELASAYLRCADRRAESGQEDGAADIYRTVYDAAVGPGVRARALQGMVRCSPPAERLQVLEEALRGTDTSGAEHEVIGEVMRRPWGRTVLQDLAGKLPELEVDDCVRVLTAAGDRGAGDLLPVVQNACSSDEPQVRLAALRALGKLGGVESVDLLATRAARGSDRERAIARESLGRLRGKKVEDEIRELLLSPDTDSAVKKELVEVLVARGATDSFDELLSLANSDSEEVSRAVLRAVCDLAEGQHLDELLRLLERSPLPLRKRVERTVSGLVRRGETEDGFERVARSFRSADKVDIKLSYLRSAGMAGGPSARRVLEGALDHENPDVRTEAVRLLARWDNAKPLRPLFRMAREADERNVRIMALQGAIDMIGISGGASVDEKLELYGVASKLASRFEERVQIISGLSGMRSPEALEMVSRFLQDSELVRSAALAAVNIAESACAADPDLARRVMEKVVEQAESEVVVTQARRIRQMAKWLRNDKCVCQYYTGSFTELPDFGSIEPEDTFPVESIGIPGRARGTNIALRFTCRVEVLRNGEYTFYTRSDDGTRLYVGGEKVVENGGQHPARERSGTIVLEAGVHSVVVEYFQGGGGKALSASWSGPGIERRPIGSGE